jgi:hypothetical protein
MYIYELFFMGNIITYDSFFITIFFIFQLQATKHAIADTCPRPHVTVIPVKPVSAASVFFSYDNVVALLVIVLFINCLVLIFKFSSRGIRSGYQPINSQTQLPTNASK